jgi:catechol 2,3-dioxygenase-like lactoylglutathione lyase family enzyme
MSTTDTRGNDATAMAKDATVDMKLEVVMIPVSDVERAKQFYESLGWRLDGDFRTDTSRGLQFTPKGSGCSIQFGTNVTSVPPGSAEGLHLIVSDIEAAREALVARGVDASEVFHCESGYACRFPGNDPPVPGPHPERGTYASFLTFNDPDGNRWILQEVTTRFPGRVEGETTYTSATDLAAALKRAAAAHGEHEARTGQADPDWPEWYAEYMVREQAGEELPT